MGVPTLLLQLIQQLVMLPPELGPLGELVLAARRVEVMANIQVFLLLLALVGELARERRREGEVEAPYL